jgi:hypothetical protein
MTKRYRAMQLALTLNKFAKSIKEDSKDLWGLQRYELHVPGKILYFKNVKEIESMIKRVIEEAKNAN